MIDVPWIFVKCFCPGHSTEIVKNRTDEEGGRARLSVSAKPGHSKNGIGIRFFSRLPFSMGSDTRVSRGPARRGGYSDGLFHRNHGGRTKQFDPVGPSDGTLAEYSLREARRVGFDRADILATAGFKLRKRLMV
jgi:hypothetical protein